MYRSLYPFILASIGFSAIVLATSMPLFEWKISEFATDFTVTHDVVVSPSPWVTRLGDSLDDGLFIFRKVSISNDGLECVKDDLNFQVRTTNRDKYLDQIFKNTSWVLGWSWIEIILSNIYILLFTLWSKQGKFINAIILAGVSIFFFLNLTQILRSVAPFPFSFPYISATLDCQYGTVAFRATISKIYNETLIILLVGILSEFGVLAVMFSQIRQVVINRKPLGEE